MENKLFLSETTVMLVKINAFWRAPFRQAGTVV